MGKVIKGYCENRLVREKLGLTGGSKGIYIYTFFRKPLDASTVKCWQLIANSNDKDSVSMGLRGLGGWMLLGPLGGLLGAATTKAQGALVAVEFRNGKKSLIQMENDLFAKFKFSIPGEVNAITQNGIPTQLSGTPLDIQQPAPKRRGCLKLILYGIGGFIAIGVIGNIFTSPEDRAARAARGQENAAHQQREAPRGNRSSDNNRSAVAPQKQEPASGSRVQPEKSNLEAKADEFNMRISSIMPKQQADFLNIMQKAIGSYKSAQNDERRKEIWQMTANAYIQTLGGYSLSDWIGSVSHSAPGGDTQNAPHSLSVVIHMNPAATLSTGMIDFLDEHKTMIYKESPLYDTASKLKKGDLVVFSGNLVQDKFDYNKNPTIHDFIYAPVFWIHFTNLKIFESNDALKLDAASITAQSSNKKEPVSPPMVYLTLSELYYSPPGAITIKNGDRILLGGVVTTPLEMNKPSEKPEFRKLGFILTDVIGEPAIDVNLEYGLDTAYAKAVESIPNEYFEMKNQGGWLWVDMLCNVHARENGMGLVFSNFELIRMSKRGSKNSN